jgi:eukaryotic-like serine/threonine-protein kinase
MRDRSTSKRSSMGDSSMDPYAAAVPRLRALAIVFAFMTVLFTTVTMLVHFDVLDPPTQELGLPRQYAALTYTVMAFGFLAACAMALITRTKLHAEQILALGLVFQVVAGLCISLAEQQVAKRGGPGVPIVCIWILAFPMLLVSPLRAAVAAHATALTIPLAMFIHVLTGRRAWPFAGFEWLAVMGGFVAAFISIFTSKVVHGLGRQVEKARQLGAYELVEQLGHGGMGEVWRAEHHSLVRPAAVKLLRRELTGRLSAAEREALNIRFQREVQATAMLSSPHTVAVFDFGHTHDGSLYYVMELLHGLDIETLVAKHGPQPAERVIYLLRQACDSLAEAHQRKLIHRDIKPANIYLCAVGLKVDFVKILDFGLVRDLSTDVRLTTEGSVSGTPAYLAPEAAAKNQFDARGDLYALGCVAYQLLTGQLVFEGETSAAMIAAHIRDQPVAPSQRSELPIPSELDAVVLACLAKNPADRPQTAEQLKELLDQIPLEAPWDQRRAMAWWSVHVPDLVERACEACGQGEPACTPAPLRRRPAPMLRDSLDRDTLGI